jgi:hypothetical protein
MTVTSLTSLSPVQRLIVQLASDRRITVACNGMGKIRQAKVLTRAGDRLLPSEERSRVGPMTIAMACAFGLIVVDVRLKTKKGAWFAVRPTALGWRLLDQPELAVETV